MKGQTALEFMFIVLIAIVYLATVTMPLVSDAKSSLTEVTNITEANNEAQKIVNTINEVALGGTGTRKTISLFVPEKTIIYCRNQTISFETTITQKPFPSQCTAMGNYATCTKTFTITSPTLNCIRTNISGPVKATATIEKSPGQVNFNAS
jgi:uncharacterized protein (UPF0333 family)